MRDIPIADDGLFYTSIEDLYESLESTFINYDTTEWHLGSFMMLDDPAEKNGRDRNCGYRCTRHKVIITSEVDQTVWVGAHTYRYYSYADGDTCPMHANDPLLAKLGKTKTSTDVRKNMLFNNKSRTAMSFEAGDAWLPKIYVKAGESFEVEVEFNWEREGVTKDWSITAWGEKGAVSVEHSEGIESDALPYQAKENAAALTDAPLHSKTALEIPTMEGIDEVKKPKKAYISPDFVLPTLGEDKVIERPVFTLPDSLKVSNIAEPEETDKEVEIFDLDLIDGSEPIDISKYQQEEDSLYSGTSETTPVQKTSPPVVKPCICTKEYAPVICTDKNEYGNACSARSAGQTDCKPK